MFWVLQYARVAWLIALICYIIVNICLIGYKRRQKRDDILKKPGALTSDERKIIESHTLIGADLLKNMTAIYGIQYGALQHHERFDGTGYPNKIKGTDISLVGRILCVADAFDAMNSDRCYRDKLPIDKIKDELNSNAGKQFDPNVVAYMLDIIEEGEHEKLVERFNKKNI